MKLLCTLTFKAIPLFVLLISCSVVGNAANTVSISQAMALPTKNNANHWQIFVGFSAGFDIPSSADDVEDPNKNAIKRPGNFYLFDIDSAQRVSIVYVYFDSTSFYTNGAFNNSGHPAEVTIYVDPSVRLDPKHRYHLYVLNVSFNGQPTDDPQPQSFVKFAPAAGPAMSAQPETGDPAIGDSLSFTAAKNREDSNIYLSGQYAGASGTKFRGAVDIKVELPFHKVLKGRTHSFGPFFEIKASTDPKADPDSMNFGFNWEWPVWRSRDNLTNPIRRINWLNAPKIESDRSFDNTNFIWDSRLRFISRSYMGKHVTFYFRPFLGQELGKNINSPLPAAQGKFIYRPIAGSTLTLIFPIKAPGLQDLSVEGSYIRRWPLRREISFEEDDDGNLQSISIGRSPRDHVTAKFNLNFSDAFGITVGYEYGQLPPAFKLVDQKTTIGLTYKIKFDR